MKKILMILLLITTCTSFKTYAASFPLGTLTSPVTIGNNVTGTFSDSYTFDFTLPANVAISITNSFVGSVGLISHFTATLDGIALDLTSVGPQLLSKLFVDVAAQITHTLTISGTAGNKGASYGGSIAMAFPTPIPAALWLFGSAIMGLISIKRKKLSY